MDQDVAGIFPELRFINRELCLELLDIYSNQLAKHEDQDHDKGNDYNDPDKLRDFKAFQIIHRNAHGITGKDGKAKWYEQETQGLQNDGEKNNQKKPGCYCGDPGIGK
jgi:hypothetical protein